MLTSPNSIDLDHLTAQLRFPANGASLCVDWNAAMQTDPANGLPFLQAEYISHAARNVFLTDDMIHALVAFAPRLASDPHLLAFFWYGRHRILTDPTLTDSWEAPWPALDETLGADAGLVNVRYCFLLKDDFDWGGQVYLKQPALAQ